MGAENREFCLIIITLYRNVVSKALFPGLQFKGMVIKGFKGISTDSVLKPRMLNLFNMWDPQ